MAKQYISPIRLLEHSAVPIDGEINVPRIKKQLVAEFDFAKTGFIDVDGYTYNKSDVLEEIERSDFAERLPYHKKIWQTKPVLAILEDNAVNLQTVEAAFAHFQNDPQFDTFFSPWFAAPFSYISRTFINQGNLADLASWLRFEEFLLPAEREEAFKPIRIFLEENSRIFKNISKENYKTFRPKIEHWIQPGWSVMMNSLPDEFFHFKNEIAVDLVNLTVKIQHAQRTDCKLISSGLVQLRDLPSTLVSTIYDNHQVYHQGSSASSSSNSSNYWWIVWVVIVLFRLFSNGGCN